VTDYGWGQFVLWHLHPGTRVAFDGRYRTVFPPALERQFLEFQTAQSGIDSRTPILDDYATDLALVPTDSNVERYLASRTDWVSVYHDDQAAIFVSATRRELGALPGATPIEVPAIPRWCVFPGRTSFGTKVAIPGGDQSAFALNTPRPGPHSRTASLHD
jgi:hypothetical protein